MKYQLTSFILTLLLFQSCAGLLSERSFIEEMDFRPDDIFIPGRDFAVVPGDDGEAYRTREDIRLRTPLSDEEVESQLESYSLRRELSHKSRSLSMTGKSQYRTALPYLESDSEKIYFLNLSPDEREDYLRTRTGSDMMAYNNRSRRGRGIASIDDQVNQDKGLLIGMSKDRVMRAWGRPVRVEVAGDPRMENERWAFDESGTTQYVYFENGKVEGWQTNK